MYTKDIAHYLDSKFPFSLQEKYDNSGIIIHFEEEEITSILVAFDITEEVINEAIKKKANVIISHHPFIFSGIKKLSSNKSNDRLVILAIQHKISIIALHTNIDNAREGVNGKIAQLFDLKHVEILKPIENTLYKLVTFVPHDFSGAVRDALFQSGAGQIGEYSNCSYSTNGEGTFKASNNTNPYVGAKNEMHFEPETKIETIVPEHLLSLAITNLKATHPYEEVAFDIIPLKSSNPQTGAGIIGELDKPMKTEDFFELLKSKFNLTLIKHSPLVVPQVKKIAFCGGSGSFLISEALKQKADIYITGDLKYHDYFETENRIILADIGHFESEQHTIDIIIDVLTKKFPNFAILKTEISTNPIQYYL
jgi:dinuclear metal center YbgI/SA1388 family protein